MDSRLHRRVVEWEAEEEIFVGTLKGCRKKCSTTKLLISCTAKLLFRKSSAGTYRHRPPMSVRIVASAIVASQPSLRRALSNPRSILKITQSDIEQALRALDLNPKQTRQISILAKRIFEQLVALLISSPSAKANQRWLSRYWARAWASHSLMHLFTERRPSPIRCSKWPIEDQAYPTLPIVRSSVVSPIPWPEAWPIETSLIYTIGAWHQHTEDFLWMLRAIVAAIRHASVHGAENVVFWGEAVLPSIRIRKVDGILCSSQE